MNIINNIILSCDSEFRLCAHKDKVVDVFAKFSSVGT
jgi:hypothetical protein